MIPTNLVTTTANVNHWIGGPNAPLDSRPPQGRSFCVEGIPEGAV